MVGWRGLGVVGTYSLKTFSKFSELPIIHQMSKTSTVEEVCKKELDTMRFRHNEVNFVATFGDH